MPGVKNGDGANRKGAARPAKYQVEARRSRAVAGSGGQSFDTLLRDHL
jgi:hypothetical protein